MCMFMCEGQTVEHFSEYQSFLFKEKEKKNEKHKERLSEAIMQHKQAALDIIASQQLYQPKIKNVREKASITIFHLYFCAFVNNQRSTQ